MDLRLPSTTTERLTVRVATPTVSDPTVLTVETCLSSSEASSTGAGPDAGWQSASWLSTASGPVVASHLISQPTPGRYGLWLRLSSDDEAIVLFAARVTVT